MDTNCNVDAPSQFSERLPIKLRRNTHDNGSRASKTMTFELPGSTVDRW